MPEIDPDEMKRLLQKYENKLTRQFNPGDEMIDMPQKKEGTTREYQEFKKTYISKKLTLYEQACKLSEKILKIQPDKKKAVILQDSIDICHIDITPAGSASFAILFPICVAIFGALGSYVVPTLLGFEPALFFVLFFMALGGILIIPLGNIPIYLADSWRMRASNQMVLSVFYVVTYMRHTSNLELAIDFAAEHLGPPLSLDFKKVIWDVETQRYESIKESLDHYLESWRKYNIEFIEAFHLIESSLYEGAEAKRLGTLDKALHVMLEETFEKMLHYAHNLKSPITMLNMLGIILPILGLVILPLVVSFISEIKWYHLATLYNIILPFGVYALGKKILSKRPTGYGAVDIARENPELADFENIQLKLGPFVTKIKPLYISVAMAITFCLIGLLPLTLHYLNPTTDFVIGEDVYGGYTISTIDTLLDEKAIFYFMEYRCPQDEKNCQKMSPDEIYEKTNGPFGLGASLISLVFVLGLGVAIGLYFKSRAKYLIDIRNKSKKLENEFASALFQLGNRLGDGLPLELAFGKVADAMADTMSGNFFSQVSQNIRRLGMSVQQAIFDDRVGALKSFPSNLIESSMKVLTVSAKKGPTVAAQALINISQYIKEMHKVEERLKDLMADVISSMESQIKFLTPVISGIVIGITAMVTAILGKLSTQFAGVSAGLGEAAGAGGIAAFGFGDGIPTYYFQLIVGVYVIQIIYILTVLANAIENGADKLNERYELGNNLIRSTVLYIMVSAIVMVLFNFIAITILKSTVAPV